MIAVPFLKIEDKTWFPPTGAALTEPNGLLAAGGCLHPDRLMAAYRLGIFPWFEDDAQILWWSPAPRNIIIPSEIHISHSLLKLLKQNKYQIRTDTAFNEVVLHCRQIGERKQHTWITPGIVAAYHKLHLLGHAHSVEVWEDNQLVGGLYGILIGSCFYGESMFSIKTNTSKIALVTLARSLQIKPHALIDCQLENPHLLTMGAKNVSREKFHQLLSQAHKEHFFWENLNNSYQ